MADKVVCGRATGLRAVLALILGVTSGVHAATVYKLVDKDGVVSFTDRPPENAQATPMTLPSANTFTPQRRSSISDPADEGAVPSPYQRLAIAAPSDRATLRRPAPLQVAPDISPELRQGHRIVLFIDGQQQDSLVVEQPPLGELQLMIAVKDADGRQLSQSEPITVFSRRRLSQAGNNEGGGGIGSPASQGRNAGTAEPGARAGSPARPAGGARRAGPASAP